MAQVNFKELNEKIDALQARINDAGKKERTIRKLESELAGLENQRKDLVDQYNKERMDVEKLQKISLTNLFHTLKNDKTEHLEQEEREVFEVKVKVDCIAAEINAQRDQLDKLKRGLESIPSLTNERQKLIDEKRQLIMSFREDVWSKLDGMQEEKAELGGELKEINEAIQAGDRALNYVGDIQNTLRSAADWGTMDMLGGGLLTTMVKRDRLDQAQDKMHQFQHQLKNFSRELRDVGSTVNFDIQIDQFLSFADYFFDGLFVDWAVQSRINDARGQMDKLDGQIRSILSNLKREKSSNEAEVRRLETGMQQIVIEAQ